MNVEKWMRQNARDEVCLLVVEDNDAARSFMREAHQEHQSQKIILQEPALDQFFPFRKIKEDPLFQQKRGSSLLQLANFCTYVDKRILMKDKRYDRWFEPWRKKAIWFRDQL